MLGYLKRAVRGRPKRTALVIALLVLLGAGAGLYGYALAQWNAAQAALKTGRADQAADARERLELCLFLWPRSPEVHRAAARAARLTGDYTVADTHLQRCIKLESSATEATQLEYLLMRAQTGEEDEVSTALFTLVEGKHPEASLILETLARAYMHRLRYGPAYGCLTRWIETAPNSKAYHWRGWVLERLNSHKAAMKDYERALERDPDLVAVRLRVAEMFLEDKQPLDALPHLQRLRRQRPDDAAVLARLGQCRFLQGQTEEARKLLEAAVQKLPNDAPILLHLARLEVQAGRPVEAEKWLRRALKADPADTEAQYTLVSCLQLQDRAEEAAQALAHYEKHKALVERANRLLKSEAERPSQGPETAAEIGIALLRVGQERQALYWLDQALVRDPRHQETHKALADYFEQKGDTQKAAAHRRWLAKGDKGTK